MGLRETLNKHKLATAVITVIFAAASFAFAVQFFRQQRKPPESSVARAWFTVDDGKTWFADDASKVTPFDRDGQPAYRCYVFTCDGGKTQFAAFLERSRPASQPPSPEDSPADAPVTRPSHAREMQVKPALTGDEGWVSDRSAEAVAIMTPKCPEGGGELTPVYPPR